MGKEIRKETDWLGREKDVIYEGGEKVGETRHEETFSGVSIDRTYDTSGRKVSETIHKRSLLGKCWQNDRSVTCVDGEKVSETVHEEGIFGKKNVIYQDEEKIGTLKTERGIVFGARKEILHEAPGHDVDLTQRRNRKEATPQHTESWPGGFGVASIPKEDERKTAIEKKIEEAADDIFHISKYTNPKTIKRESEIGRHHKVRFVPPTLLLRYKCNKCSHEWDDTWTNFGSPRELQDCIMGCSNGAHNRSLLGLYKTIKGLITGKEPFGYGRLIRSEEL